MLSFERDHESGSNATVGTVSLLPERDVLLVVASRAAVSFGLLLTCNKHSFEIFFAQTKGFEKQGQSNRSTKDILVARDSPDIGHGRRGRYNGDIHDWSAPNPQSTAH